MSAASVHHATLRVPLACWHESLESARTDPLTQLSEDGAFLMTDRPLSVGLPVFLELRLGTASNAAVGQIDAVVTAHKNGGGPDAGFDVRFVELDDALREWIKRHVEALIPAPVPEPAPVAEELDALAEEESLSDGFSLRPSSTGTDAPPTDPFAVFDEPSAPGAGDNFDPFAPSSFSQEAPAFAEDAGTDAEEGFGFFDEPSRPATPSLAAAAGNPFGETSVDHAVPMPEPVEALDPFASPAKPISGDDFAPLASFDGTEEDLGVDLEPFDELPASSDDDLEFSEEAEPVEVEAPDLGEFTDPARSNPSLAVFDEVVNDEESSGGSSFDFGEARPQTAILGTRVPQVRTLPEPEPEPEPKPEPKPEPVPEPASVVEAPRAFKSTQRMPIPDFATPKQEEVPAIVEEEKPPGETQSFRLDEVMKPPSETQTFRADPALFAKVPEAQEEPFPEEQFQTQAFSLDVDEVPTVPEARAPEPEPEPEPEPTPAPKKAPVHFETTERFVITPPEKSPVEAPQSFSSTQQFAVWTNDELPAENELPEGEGDIPTVVGEVQQYDLQMSRADAPEPEKPKITDQFAAWTPESHSPVASDAEATIDPNAAAALKPMVLEGLEPSASETLPLGVQPKDLKELARAFPEEQAEDGRTSTLRFGAVNPTPAPTAPAAATLQPPSSMLPADEVIDWNKEVEASEPATGVSPFLTAAPEPVREDVPETPVSPFLEPPKESPPLDPPPVTPRPLTPAMGSAPPPPAKSGPVKMSAEALELVDIDVDLDLDVDVVKGEPIPPRVLTLGELDGAPVGAIELPVAKLAGGSENVELDAGAFPDFELPLDPFRESTGPQPVAQPVQSAPPSISFGAEQWQVNEPGTVDQPDDDDDAFDLDLAIDEAAFSGEEVPTDDLDEAWVVAKEDEKE